MPIMHAENSKLVEGTPEKVYRILAEPAHHAKILPEMFVDFKVEPDDTITFGLKLGPTIRRFHIRSEQTDPPRLFREIQVDTGIVTDFILEPQGSNTLVTIRTKYDTKPGIQGWLEATLAPRFLNDLYEQELTKLCRYVLLV